MNLSTMASVVPMYVELAAATPATGTAGALLHDYLGILAFHFDKPGADRSAVAIGDALANLPGLLLQDSTRYQDRLSLPPTNPQAPSAGLAGLLAGSWGTVSSAPRLLPLTEPIIAELVAVQPNASDDRSLTLTLIVLERPSIGLPTLGCTTVALTLSQDASSTVWPATAPSRELSVTWSRTTYTVVDGQLVSSQQFADQLRQQGLIADLGKTAGYIAVPLN